MVEGTARLAFSHQHTGHPEEPRPTYQSVAGHARAAPDESGPNESASGVVHSRRTRHFAAVAAVAHGDHGEPQIQQSCCTRLSRAQPVGSALRTRSRSDDVATLDKN